MSWGFDLYVAKKSWLHRLDPRVKLVFVALSTAALLTFRNVWIMLAALIALHGLLLSARVPRQRLAWVWRAMLPLNILIPLLWVIFYPEGEPVLRLWFVRLTPLSAVRGISLALRLDAIAFAWFSWLFTTDQATLVQSLVRLGLPYNWGLVLALSLRYIPTFYGLFGVVSDAQQSRGLDLSKGPWLSRLRAHLPILIAMIISALRTAEKLGMALEARALGAPGVRRTSLREITFRPVDYLILGGGMVGFVGLIWLRWYYGLGAHPLRLL
ncbi:MAG: energy-coupling factor transporter transmembrane component T family protein [Chloroflexota bacterium]